MNKFKFITSCLLVMVMGLSFVSCEEVSEVIGYERGFDSYYDLKVVSCERIGANLRVDFTLKNKTGKVQQEVYINGYNYYSSDNLGNKYESNIAIDGGPWGNRLTFSMDKDETVSGSFLIENFDPTGNAKTFNLCFYAEWTTREGSSKGEKNKIAITDNRVFSNGFQTNDKKLEYKHVKSFIDGEKAYVTFTLKNNTGKALSGVSFCSQKLIDNQGVYDTNYLVIAAGTNYSSSNNWDYRLSDISLGAGETKTFTLCSCYFTNPNATKFSGEIEVTAKNYNVTDDIVRFFTVPVTSK